MRRHTLLLLGLSTLVLVGCEKKNEEASARQEEPYTPPYTSLDSMDAAAASDVDTTYESAPIETTETAPPQAVESGSDEVLAPVGADVYVVQKGDTLYKLARRFYSDQSRWRHIWEANKARLPDPDKLQVGMKLIIP